MREEVIAKIAIKVGGGDAELVLDKLNLPDGDTLKVSNKNVSVAAHNAKIINDGANFLVSVGVPLPRPSAVPKSWKDAVAEFPHYDGVFNILFWDDLEEKLVIATDFLGFQPLYYSSDSTLIQFCSDAKAFAGEPNFAGWGAFLKFGCTLGQNTLTKSIQKVPAASVIVVDAQTQKITSSVYWRFPEKYHRAPIEDISESLEDSMVKAIDIAQNHQIVMMSGGFDSRLSACYLTKFDQEFSGLVVSHADEYFDMDRRLASACARKMNFSCGVGYPDRNYFSSQDFLEYLSASDSEYPNVSLFISQVHKFVPNATIWEGLIPGITMACPQQVDGGFDALLAEKTAGLDSLTWRAAERVFGSSIAGEMWAAGLEAWEEEKAQYPDDEFGVTQFIIRNRSRNRTSNNPFKVYQRKAQVLSPGMTRRFVEQALSIPFSEKKDGQFYLKFYEKYFPEALSVPVLTGGSIVNTGKATLSYYYNRTAAYLHDYMVRTPVLLRYPNVARKVGLDVTNLSVAPSAFVNSPALYEDDDPFISQDFLNDLRAGRAVPVECKRLLLYWKVWRWLRDGSFWARLQPDVGASAAGSD